MYSVTILDRRPAPSQIQFQHINTGVFFVRNGDGRLYQKTNSGYAHDVQTGRTTSLYGNDPVTPVSVRVEITG